ncbi:hypothetical protein ACIRG5_20690 [Lentzea sp. NPDC102401]|uniref:hypothetical protein n=1 Tax=Lentzea sp. NPDC102401 TaxID=3364128 RepID=UPI003830978C
MRKTAETFTHDIVPSEAVASWTVEDLPAGLRLIDWDTVGLAPPERDLWLIGGDSAFCSLRWAVNDIADFAVSLRAPHEQSRDAELTLHYFTETLKSL